MRIAQIVPMNHTTRRANKNGLEFVASWITEELVKRGHEVTLFAPSDTTTQANLISPPPEKVVHAAGFVWEEPVQGNSGMDRTESIGNSFDVIHTHTSTIPFLKPPIEIPVVYTLHHTYENDYWKDYLASEKSAARKKAVSNDYRKLHFTYVSNDQKLRFERSENYRTKKNSVILNGIPVDTFAFNRAPNDYLLYIGYINKNKGADTAVRIAQKLDMRLILAGSNFGEEAFFNKHIKPHLNEKIKYVGPADFRQKNELYRNAYAKLAPIEWDEPFGLTIVEAQACGTPVIAFNKGAASELIIEGKTGFIVDTEEEMIEAVKKIEQVDRTACRKNAEENFSVQKMVDNYEALYRKIV